MKKRTTIKKIRMIKSSTGIVNRFTVVVHDSRHKNPYYNPFTSDGALVAFIRDELHGTETRLDGTESNSYIDSYRMGSEYARMLNIEFNEEYLYIEELKVFLKPTKSELHRLMYVFDETGSNSRFFV